MRGAEDEQKSVLGANGETETDRREGKNEYGFLQKEEAMLVRIINSSKHLG